MTSRCNAFRFQRNERYGNIFNEQYIGSILEARFAEDFFNRPTRTNIRSEETLRLKRNIDTIAL